LRETEMGKSLSLRKSPSSSMTDELAREMAAVQRSLLLEKTPSLVETTSILPPPPSALQGIFGPLTAKNREEQQEMRGGGGQNEERQMMERVKSCREQIRRKLALKAAKSMPSMMGREGGGEMGKKREGRNEEEREDDDEEEEEEGADEDGAEEGMGEELAGAEGGNGEEQFICRYCEKDFRRPDILSRYAWNPA
jgi:hypothetical protein